MNGNEQPTARSVGDERKRKPEGDAAGSSAAPEEPTSRWERTKANLKTILGAVALALFIRIVLFEAFEIEGPSMEPTLLNGDRVVVAKFSYGLFLPFRNEAVVTWGVPNVGDVVIVKSPADNIDIVKRVVGLPGDLIEIRDDAVFRNGQPLGHETVGVCDPTQQMQTTPGCEWYEERLGEHVYRTSGSLVSAPSNLPPRRVPPGHVFILGDHRDHSNDSRYFGPVPIQRVKGRALAIYWSNGGDGLRGERLFSTVD